MVAQYKCIVLILITFISCSCKQNYHKTDDISETSLDSAICNKEIDTRFPDTITTSVNNIYFEIDTCLKNVPGKLVNLNNKYKNINGIFTFRGDPSRQPPFTGKINGKPKLINIDWVFYTDYDTRTTNFGTWGGGSGWTGQPLYINWTDEQLNRIKTHASNYLSDAFSNEEILVGSLCGKVYFIDFKTGKASRRPYDVSNPIKGTMSFDPTMNGNLYIGHGIPCTKPFGALILNLYNHKLISLYAEDKNAWRLWGAYDPSPISVGDFMFRIGENGTIYKLYCVKDSVTLHSTLRYRMKSSNNSPGIESSLAVCRNYGYFGDNHGNIIAINLDNLHPIWVYNNHDDTDATIIVEEVGNIPFVYTGSEIQRQGNIGFSYFTKLNGLTGEVVWEQKIEGRCDSINGKLREGGMFSSPLIGHGDCEGMIFSNFCTLKADRKGECIAMNLMNGEILYKTPLHYYSWSSPIAFYNEYNEMFIVTGDTLGYLYIIQGKTGEILMCKHIANNFESSPIVIGNSIVCGSRGREIYKITIE